MANRDGNTALHLAAFFAHPDLVQLLLNKDASVQVKNLRGETPLDMVSADWSPELERTYKYVGNLIDIELDLARVKQARPKVAELLREQGQ